MLARIKQRSTRHGFTEEIIFTFPFPPEKSALEGGLEGAYRQ